MHFTKAVAIFISSEFASPMIDTFMPVSPGLQSGINAVLIRINKSAGNDSVFDEWLNRLLLHQSFVFRLARDLASPTHRRVPKALQIIYRIIRPDTVANPDREVDGCTTITYHAMHGRVDATHILNRQTL